MFGYCRSLVFVCFYYSGVEVSDGTIMCGDRATS